jgi:chromosome segregation protein
MRLKSLRVQGFKSFAQRTEFTFPEGLTCIVGPNGCGKSNVVDAIKWVMGEQRPTALRGSEMQDVIFGGTAARKPLGMAEVTLQFDNTLNLLDIDWSEVEITRRLYRDGTSEYLLNKNRCRLKDIRELFMDTGGGRGGMTIMEQGKIDQVLRESHQERRAIFEEAAGIAKYKARRKESLRRLERVESDLMRVSDVVAEKQRLVRSLKIQAGRAERYQALAAEMRAKRVQLAVHRYGALLAEQEEATGRVDELSGAESAAREEVARAVADCRVAEDELETSRTAASRLEQEIATLEGQAETAREKSAFAARLMSELDGKIRWYAGEIESSAARLEDLDGIRSEAEAALDRARSDRTERERDVQAAQALIEERAGEVAQQRRDVDVLSREVYELVERRSRLESKRSRLDARHQALEAQRRRLQDRLAGMRSETETARARVAQAATAHDAAQAALTASQESLRAAEERVTATREALRAARESVSVLDREVSGARSRCEVLAHLCRQMEGVGEGAKRVVAAARDGAAELAGVRGLLVELLETDAVDAGAVESALGPYASAVVVESFADVERVAAHLAQSRGGRCLLLPLDQVVSTAAPVDGALSGVVRCDAELRPLVDALLGRSIRVATLEEARSARSTPDGVLRVVTAGGEVIEPTGAVAAGGESGGAGVLRRQSELRELTARLEELGAELDAARAALSEAEAAHAASGRAVTEARDAGRRAESESHRARNENERAAADLRRLESDAGRLDGEIAEIAVELEQIEADTEAAAAELEEVAAAREDRESRRDEIARVLAAGEARLREAEEARADVRVQLASVAERCASLESRLQAVVDEVQDLEEGVEEAREELSGCERRRGEAQERGKQAREDLARAQKRREECIVGLAEVRHRLSESRSRLEERRTLLESLEKEAAAVTRELQRFRLRQSEARVRVENLIERMQEELEVDLHAAWEDAGRAPEAAEGEEPAPGTPVYVEPETPAFDADAVEAEIQELRDRLGRMGNVNLEALDQLGDTEKEAEELLQQHADLTKSRESLLEAIRKIDVESRELFTATFEAVRTNFQAMFRRLFEGGKADIYLDEGDVLEAGIDIVARPPGKEPRSISLLSGGERTMTAVALLFAIYQSKPSPFCLLDEVDAALDEANVHRFATVVHEFAEESQFIIITHNKRTMSAADTIFGVSMPEPGVSRRLAVRLDQVGEDGEILAA